MKQYEEWYIFFFFFFFFEKEKTDGILNGVRFCLWELLHIIDFSYNKGNKRFIINVTLLNNVEKVL